MYNNVIFEGATQFCHLVLWASMWCLAILMSIQSGVLNFTIGRIKKVIHFNGERPSFCNMM